MTEATIIEAKPTPPFHLDPAGAPDPLVHVAKLGFVGFASSDVDRLVRYYVDGLSMALAGRSGDVAYVTAGAGGPCIVIESAGASRGRTSVGFEIQGELAEAERRLRAAEIAVEHRSDPQPGIAASLVIEEWDGTPLHLYEAQEQPGHPGGFGPRPSKLGHVASFASNLQDTQRFYEQVLGFRWSDMIADWFTFLRCGADHHSVNFIGLPGHGLHHVAFEMRDVTHLKDAVDHLANHGHQLVFGPGRHGPGHNLFSYHRDPDGNVIELFTELDRVIDERTGAFEPRPWHGDGPSRARVWPSSPATANVWGPMSAEGDMRPPEHR